MGRAPASDRAAVSYRLGVVGPTALPSLSELAPANLERC